MIQQELKKQLRKMVKESASTFLFVTVLFIVGVLFGAILVNSLDTTQKSELFQHLTQFFAEMQIGQTMTAEELFFSSFQENAKTSILIWLLGISMIGLPFILILLFAKGVVTGFTIGFLVNQAGLKGFLLACGSILPQNLILVPVFLFLASTAITISIKMMKRQFTNEKQESFKKQLFGYSAILVGSILLLFIASAIEGFISPALMNALSQSI